MVRYSEGVIIPEGLRVQIEALAKMYANMGAGDLVCTSGLRTAERQASAMYSNYVAKAWVGYQKADLEAEVKKVFDDLYPRPNTPREKTVAAMAEVINRQIMNGKFLSYHLIGQAADFALDGLNVDKFKACAADMGAYPYLETVCMHVTFAHA